MVYCKSVICQSPVIFKIWICNVIFWNDRVSCGVTRDGSPTVLKEVSRFLFINNFLGISPRIFVILGDVLIRGDLFPSYALCLAIPLS